MYRFLSKKENVISIKKEVPSEQQFAHLQSDS